MPELDKSSRSSKSYTTKSDIHTLKVKTRNGSHHLKRCQDCGHAYSHKKTTLHCPTCGVKISQGHHH